MRKLKLYPELIAIAVVSFLTHFWNLFTPNAVVFDEVYFKVFASHYLDGHYFFDIHPPLGKLLLALLAYTLHLSASSMQNGTALPLRLLPAFAGSLIPIVAWSMLRRLKMNRPFAFLGAAAIALDNALLVESRFILVDSMLLLFGLLAVNLYLIYRDSASKFKWSWLILAAVFAGAAASTKWTGLNALAIILFIWAWDYRQKHKPILRVIGELSAIILIPLVLYVSVFWVHFQLLPKTGDGDAFMSPQFQATLVGSAYYDPKVHMSFAQKFIELNEEMYLANQTLTASHPYGSHWYMWPLEVRPIYYWEGAVLPDGSQGNIYLLGDPIVWWGVAFAIVFGLVILWILEHKLAPKTKWTLILLSVAFAINYMPFMAITRVMFLYHYLYAFIYTVLFAIVLWSALWHDLIREHVTTKQAQIAYCVILLAILAGFLYFAPLSYGTPMSPAQLQDHMWLHSWR